MRYFLFFLFLIPVAAHTDLPRSYISFEEVQPIFDAIGGTEPGRESWSTWLDSTDRSIRARVAEGDEASILNLLLFGTSFTGEPRIAPGELDKGRITAAVAARLSDFERALANPGTNERLLFAQQVLRGSNVRTRLATILRRAVEEGETHARLVREAGALGDPSLEFAERSRLYRDRGLSSDTTLRVNLALEDAFARLKASGLVQGPTSRIAVVGPGLDFADKHEGHDFYPPQTIQPFAIIDTLLRLELSPADDIQVTAFDVNPRVRQHIERARAAALRKTSYRIHLPQDSHVRWTPRLMAFRTRFGDRIGSAAAPVRVPRAAVGVEVRAVDVKPEYVGRVTAQDLNIVVQHTQLPATSKFDIVIATNVFVYYDRLQQALAMANLAQMVKPGALLLSNNALVEIPSVGWKSVGYSKTMYSDRDEDGDVIVWYQRQ